jgi:hypothetical protein
MDRASSSSSTISIGFSILIKNWTRPQPGDADVGSLSDDWELTRELADVPAETEVGTYALTEVAQLLWYIGYRQVPRG